MAGRKQYNNRFKAQVGIEAIKKSNEPRLRLPVTTKLISLIGRWGTGSITFFAILLYALVQI